MNIAIFGGFSKGMLASGWTRETAVAVFGGGEFDLTNIVPGPDAQITAFAIFGGIDIVVDEGTQVAMSGFNLFGSRAADLNVGDGPAMKLRAFSIFGSVHVSTPG